MALIECPSCGKQISDKATQCPSCGYKNENQACYVKDLKCEECGAVLKPDDIMCPICGCPVEKTVAEDQTQKVEVTGIKIASVDKKKRKVIMLTSILILVLIIGAAIDVAISQKNSMLKYEENLSSATSEMIIGAATAEDVGGLIHDVWYNTIYEKSDSKTDKFTKREGIYSFNEDFNDSLFALMSDEDFNEKIEQIKDNQESVNDIMKKLVNPPNEYKEAYDKLQTLYDAYLELTNLAINPTGSLKSYTEKYNNADTAVVNAYQAMQRYIN